MKLLKLSGVIFLSVMILSACGGKGATDDTTKASTKTTNSNTEGSNNQKDTAMNQDSKGGKQKSSGDADNQLGLKIGETGTVKSNINHYQITLESAQIKNQIAGNKSMLDELVVVHVKVKNIGNASMEAEDVVSALQLTEDLKGSGTDDISGNIGLKQFQGAIAPGEFKKGRLIFDAYKSKKYYLVDGSGLADQGAGLQNKVTWTFKASEAK